MQVREGGGGEARRLFLFFLPLFILSFPPFLLRTEGGLCLRRRHERRGGGDFFFVIHDSSSPSLAAFTAVSPHRITHEGQLNTCVAGSSAAMKKKERKGKDGREMYFCCKDSGTSSISRKSPFRAMPQKVPPLSKLLLPPL